MEATDIRSWGEWGIKKRQQDNGGQTLGSGNLTDMPERVRTEGQSRREGVCGLGHAPKLLSPSVSFSVKWVHSLPVLCWGRGWGRGEGEGAGMQNAWEALL